jgi:hypothetical protein
MSRWSILLLVAATACGGTPKSAPISPLPGDKPAEPAPVAKKEPEPAPPAEHKPVEPVVVKIPATKIAVKLVSPGKGKRAPLRYTAKPGDKQQVELAMDFSAKQTEAGKTTDQTVPTMVLVGDAEATTVDKDGNTAFTLTVSGTDAREVKDAKPSADQFKQVVQALTGLTISSTLGANGVAGDVTLRIEKPSELSSSVLELVRLTLPSLPVLPAEPVGVGAKWQATANAKLSDSLDITQVTDYELVAHKGTMWTIKGTTKVSGADQTLEGGKITSIKGTGSTEATLADGTLYPVSRTSLQTEFTASEGDKSVQFGLKVGGTITPKK